MKQATIYTLALTACLSLAACSHQGERQLASVTEAKAATEPSLATPVLSQPLALNNCVIDTVTSDVVGQKIYMFARKAAGKPAKKQTPVFSDEKCQREIARQ